MFKNFSGNISSFYAYIKSLNERVRQTYALLNTLKHKRKTLECKLPCPMKFSSIRQGSDVIEVDCPTATTREVGIPVTGGTIDYELKCEDCNGVPQANPLDLICRSHLPSTCIHMATPVIKNETWFEFPHVQGSFLHHYYAWGAFEVTFIVIGGGGGGAAIAGNYFTQGGSCRGGHAGEHRELTITLQKWWRVTVNLGGGGSGGTASYTAGSAVAAVADGNAGGGTTVSIYDENDTLVTTITSAGGAGGEASINPADVQPHDWIQGTGEAVDYDFGYPEEFAVSRAPTEFGDKLKFTGVNDTNFRFYDSQGSVLRSGMKAKSAYRMGVTGSSYTNYNPDDSLTIYKGVDITTGEVICYDTSDYENGGHATTNRMPYGGSFAVSFNVYSNGMGGDIGYSSDNLSYFHPPIRGVGGWAGFGIHGQYTAGSDIDRSATGGTGAIGYVRMRRAYVNDI